jgi:hypothetical protein
MNLTFVPSFFVDTFATIDLKNCTMKLKDGKTIPNEVEIKIGEGNFTYTERVERDYELDRGILDTVRNGDETPMEVRFDFKWEFIKSKTGDSVPTIEEALKQIGLASSWVTTSSDACEPYSVDVELENDPGCAPEQREITTFPDFRYEELSHDLRNASISCSGRCNATEPTIVRQT